MTYQATLVVDPKILTQYFHKTSSTDDRFYEIKNCSPFKQTKSQSMLIVVLEMENIQKGGIYLTVRTKHEQYFLLLIKFVTDGGISILISMTREKSEMCLFWSHCPCRSTYPKDTVSWFKLSEAQKITRSIVFPDQPIQRTNCKTLFNEVSTLFQSHFDIK